MNKRGEFIPQIGKAMKILRAIRMGKGGEEGTARQSYLVTGGEKRLTMYNQSSPRFGNMRKGDREGTAGIRAPRNSNMEASSRVSM